MRQAIRLVTILSFFLSTALAAQTASPRPLQGTVEDPGGTPVSLAKVTLRPQAAGAERIAITDEGGHFVFAAVPPGDYLLEVQVVDFAEARIPVQVGPEPLLPVQVQLKLATVTQQITVSAEAPDPVAPEQNADSIQVESELLKSLPAQDSNPLAAAALFLDPAASGSDGPKIVVDGVEGGDLDVPASSVKSVAVNRNPYSAEFSRPGKGRIEVTTRSGSLRHFHRRFTFSLRDATLDARNAFATVRPPMQRSFFEGQVDGPLFGGKATFFLGADYLRDEQSAFVEAVTPSGALRLATATPERAAHVLGRVDVHLNPFHTLTVRYNLVRDSLRNQGVGAFDLPERARNLSNDRDGLRVSETAVLSPHFSNELRFDFKRKSNEAQSLNDAPAILVLGAFHGGGGQVFSRQHETDFELQELGTYLHGRHTLRFGAMIKARRVDVLDRSNFGGTFTFSSLAALQSGQPFLFTINQGDPQVSFRQTEFSYFVQDEIRLRPNLSLLLGMRHEWQSNLGDHNNLAPRLALAWSSADGRTVVRAGAGIFYQRQPVSLEQQSLLFGGARLRQIVIQDPTFPQALNPGVPANLPPPSVVRLDPTIQSPYSVQASVGVERQLGPHSLLSVDYTFLRGQRLYRMRDLNAPLPLTGLRPDADFLNVDQIESSGSSLAHSLSVSFRTRIRGRLQLVSQYTFSRSLDNTSGPFFLPADNFDLRNEWGRSDFDRRHRLNLAAVVDLPRGFKVSTITSISSGPPFNIVTGFDGNGDTVSNDRPLGVGRNTGQGPGSFEVDVRFSKKFKLTRFKENDDRFPDVELRADAFNVFNHVNQQNFVGNLNSPFFGRANSAYPARRLQLSLRVTF